MENYIPESYTIEIDQGFLDRVESGETKLSINREKHREMLKTWSDKKDGRLKLERYSAELYLQGYKDAFAQMNKIPPFKMKEELKQVPFEDILSTISTVEGMTQDILNKIEKVCDEKYGG